ncbi:MAG: type II toxin-antitoxin system RelE/ParE family toxin [Acinetobacter populi]|jgi:putative addiction module killer protein|uniref:type II toxin-antitoxin system RelE/ParE family toxin n=1 Tax=Acinetobacter populi TaxID=1582270 RepID=UPI002354CC0F|nr:type II toxin-antitoxin system RelE/ParE family toxin [Acinetobacter populi]MCH4248582.1 type II toxin-antitoxin system RelE/ParE family toxin [Acinetobacter populi]
MQIKKLPPFERWFRKLRDVQAKSRIQARLDRLEETGHLGDVKPIEMPVCEMRFFFGDGYRVYYIQEQESIVLLLIGGDKTSQSDDIEKAKALAAAYLAVQQEQRENDHD